MLIITGKLDTGRDDLSLREIELKHVTRTLEQKRAAAEADTVLHVDSVNFKILKARSSGQMVVGQINYFSALMSFVRASLDGK